MAIIVYVNAVATPRNKLGQEWIIVLKEKYVILAYFK